jgi:hypothetical protein
LPGFGTTRVQKSSSTGHHWEADNLEDALEKGGKGSLFLGIGYFSSERHAASEMHMPVK